MKKRDIQPKLSLNKETLAKLTEENIARINGGVRTLNFRDVDNKKGSVVCDSVAKDCDHRHGA